MIQIKNLTKKFGDFTAVDQASFALEKGQKLILLGTSGSGKTTTLKMINRLIEPTSGEVYINGENVMQQSPEKLRQKIGYVIQNSGLFPHYTVGQNIAIVPQLLHWEKSKISQRIDELLAMMGLPTGDFKNRYPRELSGGQKQRIGIARALAVDPPLMLMDEPFGALDPITRSQIRDEFDHLEGIQEKTILMVTHDVFEAVELGDMICLMDQGQIQQLGTPAELIFSPQNQFVADFFDSQRFQLELKVMTLEDILPTLTSHEIADHPVLPFQTETDLLMVLENAAQSHQQEKPPIIQIQDRQQKTLKNTTRQEILAAFYRNKQN